MLKKVITLCALFALATAGAASLPLDDKEIAKRLVGTWVDEPSEQRPFVSTVTYKADGTGTELVHLREQAEATGVRVTTRWSVTNSILCIRSIATTDPKRIPVGVELKDRVISISEDKFVFEALEGYGESNGKRTAKVRKKEA
jgi:hypothetical protein